MSTFSNRLKKAMEKANIKQSELVKLTGISKGAISQYLKGEYEPKLDNLDKIAEALNVPLDELTNSFSLSPDKEREINNLENTLLIEDDLTTEKYITYLQEINRVFGYDYFNIDNLTQDEILEFAKAILEYMELLGLKYNKTDEERERDKKLQDFLARKPQNNDK